MPNLAVVRYIDVEEIQLATLGSLPRVPLDKGEAWGRAAERLAGRGEALGALLSTGDGIAEILAGSDEVCPGDG